MTCKIWPEIAIFLSVGVIQELCESLPKSPPPEKSDIFSESHSQTQDMCQIELLRAKAPPLAAKCKGSVRPRKPECSTLPGPRFGASYVGRRPGSPRRTSRPITGSGSRQQKNAIVRPTRPLPPPQASCSSPPGLSIKCRRPINTSRAPVRRTVCRAIFRDPASFTL